MLKKTQIVNVSGDFWIGDESGQINFFTDTSEALSAVEEMKSERKIDNDQPFSIDRIEDFWAVRLVAYFPAESGVEVENGA